MLTPKAAVFLGLISQVQFVIGKRSDDHLKAGSNVHLVLDSADVWPRSELNLDVAKARVGFPGDLTVGYRLPNEVVYTRTIAIDNPSDETKVGLITFSISGGTFHYVSARNRDGSFGVLCDEPYTLGGSETGFKGGGTKRPIEVRNEADGLIKHFRSRGDFNPDFMVELFYRRSCQK